MIAIVKYLLILPSPLKIPCSWSKGMRGVLQVPGPAGSPLQGFRTGGRAGLGEGAEACASPACIHLGKGVLDKSYQELVVAEMKVRGDFIHPSFSSLLVEGCSPGCHFFRVQLSEDPKWPWGMSFWKRYFKNWWWSFYSLSLNNVRVCCRKWYFGRRKVHGLSRFYLYFLHTTSQTCVWYFKLYYLPLLICLCCLTEFSWCLLASLHVSKNTNFRATRFSEKKGVKRK